MENGYYIAAKMHGVTEYVRRNNSFSLLREATKLKVFTNEEQALKDIVRLKKQKPMYEYSVRIFPLPEGWKIDEKKRQAVRVPN